MKAPKTGARLPSDDGKKLINEIVSLWPVMRANAVTHHQLVNPEWLQIQNLLEKLYSNPEAWGGVHKADPFFGFQKDDVVGRGRHRDERIYDLRMNREAPTIYMETLGRPTSRYSREAGDAYTFIPAAVAAALRDADLAYMKIDPRPECEHCHMEMTFSEGVFSCPKP